MPRGVYERSEEHKRKLSKAHKGKKQSESTNKKRSKSLKGHIVSEETRKRISNAKQGTIPWNKGLTKKTNAVVRKIGESLKDKKHSEEHKRKNSEARKGKKNYRWKGGKTITKEGYIEILKPNHPFANCRGYIFEHRLVMEKEIGRYLKPEEVVHHIDGNPANNAEKNLKLFACTNEHTAFHNNQKLTKMH